jgi:predicted ATPase
MKYLDSFFLPTRDKEASYLYPTKYPFGFFSEKELSDVYFADITIIYGSNGSGKSTLLNIINNKLGFARKSVFYEEEAFRDYMKRCYYTLAIDDNGKQTKIPLNSKMIASEDIINFIFSIRNKNIQSEELKQELIDEYQSTKFTPLRYEGFVDYESLVKKTETQRTTQTKYVEKRVKFLKQFSNGENVLRYFDSELENDGLYLLDEPENCLSPKFQLELAELIQRCARYCGCQFVIATHSPFLLSLPGAKIYNLDSRPIKICKWTELENVRAYYEFFRRFETDFTD